MTRKWLIRCKTTNQPTNQPDSVYIHLSLNLSDSIQIYLSIYLSVCLSICLSDLYLSLESIPVYLSLFPSLLCHHVTPPSSFPPFYYTCHTNMLTPTFFNSQLLLIPPYHFILCNFLSIYFVAYEVCSERIAAKVVVTKTEMNNK